jgi:3-hydroxyacyl-CoA dehydrogenase / enoyl-CoA hydratase / 3-hydroxybutyryl-CoA epimerase
MPLFQSETVVVEKDRDGSAFLKIDVPGQTHNMLSRRLLADLDAAFDAVAAQARLPLLVIRSGKPSGFLVGADLHGFLEIADGAEAEALSAQGQRLFVKLAALPTPTLAGIHGPCLGGGLELALACDYRLVLDNPKTQLGLPEVTLGLLPAWGGTQRLPRVVGLRRALEMILEGKRLGAREALRWGLADVAPTNEAELRSQLAYLGIKAIQQGKRPLNGLPFRTWGQRLTESTALSRGLLFTATERVLRNRVPDDMPAPAEALQAVRVGLKEGMAAGLAFERAAAGRLALSPACHNLISLWLRGEKARKLPDDLRAVAAPEIRNVGVVGAGVMGAGIAQLAAIRGARVIVREINQAALDAGLKRIKELFDKAVGRRVLSEDEAKKRFAAVRGTTAWDGFSDVDVVVEAASEDLDAKRAVFRELDIRTRPTTVLATNTSSLRVGSLKEGLTHPERVGGMHFFNPVHKMPLVEVVRAGATNERTVATLMQWAITLGKTPVVVRDSPGFVVNRILTPYLAEAALLVAEGMKIKEIDHVMKRFGMPMGPLELLDQIGLDVAAHVARSMAPLLTERFGDNPAFDAMREKGWLGQKSGRGFYIHRGRARTPNHLAENLLRVEAAGEGAAVSQGMPPEIRAEEARDRLVLLMVNEAAMVFGEGLAETAELIDLAMVLGTGWAPHRGGPLRYADERGLVNIVEALESLAARHGRRFTPTMELKKQNEPQRHRDHRGKTHREDKNAS